MRDSNPEPLSDGRAEVAPATAYAVSEAIPLHVFGLVPPPPEIGAHLLWASPIEVAAMSADATAQAMAAAWPAPVQPVDAALPPVAPVAFEQTFGAVCDNNLGAGAGARHEDAAGSATQGDAILPEPAGIPGHAAPEAVEPAASTSGPVMATVAAAMAADGAGRTEGEGLATLDLSRRGAGQMANEPPMPKQPGTPLDRQAISVLQSELPRVMAKPAAAAAVHAKAPPVKRSVPAPAFFEAASWPGFLTGLVVALVIGAGIYVTLVGS